VLSEGVKCGSKVMVAGGSAALMSPRRRSCLDVLELLEVLVVAVARSGLGLTVRIIGPLRTGGNR